MSECALCKIVMLVYAVTTAAAETLSNGDVEEISNVFQSPNLKSSSQSSICSMPLVTGGVLAAGALTLELLELDSLSKNSLGLTMAEQNKDWFLEDCSA